MHHYDTLSLTTHRYLLPDLALEYLHKHGLFSEAPQAKTVEEEAQWKAKFELS